MGESRADQTLMPKSIAFIDQGLESWQQIFPLIHANLYTFIINLNLHSNKLTSLDGSWLKLMPNLVILDISSNQVNLHFLL